MDQPDSIYVGYLFITSQLQILPFCLLCEMGLDPLNVFPFPADVMLSVVRRESEEYTAGREVSASWSRCFFSRLPQCSQLQGLCPAGNGGLNTQQMVASLGASSLRRLCSGVTLVRHSPVDNFPQHPEK